MKFVEKVQFLAYDPGVTPREGGLPGLDVLKNVAAGAVAIGG
ncbi:hypothetical protein ABT143_04460 [Streptomyces sp. NPDC002033]